MTTPDPHSVTAMRRLIQVHDDFVRAAEGAHRTALEAPTRFRRMAAYEAAVTSYRDAVRARGAMDDTLRDMDAAAQAEQEQRDPEVRAANGAQWPGPPVGRLYAFPTGDDTESEMRWGLFVRNDTAATAIGLYPAGDRFVLDVREVQFQQLGDHAAGMTVTPLNRDQLTALVQLGQYLLDGGQLPPKERTP